MKERDNSEQPLVVLALHYLLKAIGYTCFVIAVPSVTLAWACKLTGGLFTPKMLTEKGCWWRFWMAPLRWFLLSSFLPCLTLQVGSLNTMDFNVCRLF